MASLLRFATVHSPEASGRTKRAEWLSRSDSIFVGSTWGLSVSPRRGSPSTVLFLRLITGSGKIDSPRWSSFVFVKLSIRRGLSRDQCQDEHEVVRLKVMRELSICVFLGTADNGGCTIVVSRCYGERTEASLLTFEFRGMDPYS